MVFYRLPTTIDSPKAKKPRKKRESKKKDVTQAQGAASSDGNCPLQQDVMGGPAGANVKQEMITGIFRHGNFP